MEVTIIGHGSLMSGRGLSFSGRFQLRTAGIIALADCTRGFAKLSKYGDRFATDLELERPALEGAIVAPQTEPDGRVETLGLSVSLEDCGRLVKREGYRPEAMQALVERARKYDLGVAEWLWRLAAEQAHDLLAYRRQLFSITGYTSPHYIPHPVRLAEAGYALIFLAPGPRGTGTPAVVSIRQQTGINTILSTVETWRRKPNADQIAYFLSCLLGGAHGINVRDFLASVGDHRELAETLYQHIQPVLAEEATCFLQTTGLTPEQYTQAFGSSEAALRRSGLGDFLEGFDS